MNPDPAFVVENNPDLADLFAVSMQMSGFQAEIIPNDQEA
jgi:hypothetical protein